MKRLLQLSIPVALLLVVMLDSSCKKDDPPLEVISGFTFVVDANDFKTVQFTNASANFSSVEWDFGDGSAGSTEENPSHTFPGVGSYTVKLTAKALEGSGTDQSTQTVVIADPNAELTKLVGDVSKTWILLREVEAGVAMYPLEVGPIDRSTIWWAQGLNNDELANRPCILNDEYVFGRDGSYQYKTNGDFWGEGGVYHPDIANKCQTSDPANYYGPNNEDLTAFGDGTHTFRLGLGANPTLTVIGYGAHVALPKIATDLEVKLPQDSVTLDIVRLAEGTVADTLILESKYKWDPANAEDNAYWRIVLVSYRNPADTPPLPGPKPNAGFSADVNGLTVTFTNTTTGGVNYSWDFGDGGTSTAESPSHTYAAGGPYIVTMTATNPNGASVASREIWVDPADITDADLQGTWKVRVAPVSIFVGPGMGDPSWWQVPLNFLDGSSTGADDWSCMTNDEFIFSAGGVYEYKTNGDARNDGYMGSPNGCIDDAAIAASGNGAAFGSHTHSYVLTPAGGGNRAKITLTNGATGAAFIGFYKGYYGGENTNSANPPNGGNADNIYEVIAFAKGATKDYLFVSVDITADHSGTASWSVILER
ncbi:MAG: PKD domain-containing protein [Saprospiraceae bacterium]